MALTYTQNTILFSNIPDGGLTKINYKPTFNDFKYAEYGVTPFINMVEANWNGAQLKNGSTLKATLNTTGEMLSILQTAYNYATTYNVKYSGGKLYDDGGTEIKVITEDELTAKSYITTSVADENYADKSHQHSRYADRDHNHASYYAPISHASTATKYGVGTDANYGHLKISGAYTTKTSADTALSLEGAHNLYTAFVTRISELTAEIATLNSRVATLEGHHTTKPVTAITVTPETYTLYGKGKTAQLSWSITPSDASNKTVTWSSGDTGIATVSAGKITTVSKGRTTITATANGGSNINDTCAVTVNEARITGVNAGNDITAIYGGSISRIVPTQTIQQGDGEVFTTGYTYTRTSGSSVTVNDGVLTIVEAGASVITVKSKADPTKSDVVNVTVAAQATKYYWYLGQVKPTSDNYTTLASQVTSYPTTYDYTVERRAYIYILVSNSKTLSKIIDTSNGFDINYFYLETDSPVSGYKLYRTAAVAAGCPLRFTIS